MHFALGKVRKGDKAAVSGRTRGNGLSHVEVGGLADALAVEVVFKNFIYLEEEAIHDLIERFGGLFLVHVLDGLKVSDGLDVGLFLQFFNVHRKQEVLD